MSKPILKFLSPVLRRSMLHFPGKVQIETTTLCNANCIMCPHSSITRVKGHMPFPLFKKIIDECARHSGQVAEVYPFLNGELFLTPQWDNYLAYAREKLPAARLIVFTNGSLLNETNAGKLLEIAPDALNVSFDGTSKEVYESIRRNLKFEEVEGNIRAFMARRGSDPSGKPLVSVSVIEMDKTSADIPAFVEKWGKVVDKVSVEPYNTWTGEIADRGVKGRRARSRVPCPRLWQNLTVLNSGKVALCCLDYDGQVELGDLNSASIEEVWTGKRLREMRRLHEAGDYDGSGICRDCDYGKYQSETPFWWR